MASSFSLETHTSHFPYISGFPLFQRVMRRLPNTRRVFYIYQLCFLAPWFDVIHSIPSVVSYRASSLSNFGYAPCARNSLSNG